MIVRALRRVEFADGDTEAQASISDRGEALEGVDAEDISGRQGSVTSVSDTGQEEEGVAVFGKRDR